MGSAHVRHEVAQAAAQAAADALDRYFDYWELTEEGTRVQKSRGFIEKQVVDDVYEATAAALQPYVRDDLPPLSGMTLPG